MSADAPLVVYVPHYTPKPGWRRIPFAVSRALWWLGRGGRLRRGFLFRVGSAGLARFGVRHETRLELGEWTHESLWSRIDTAPKEDS